MLSPACVQAGAGVEPRLGDGEDARAELAQRLAARRLGLEAELRHGVAQALALGEAPALDLVPGGVERRIVVEQADPERGQRADLAPAAAVGAAHLEEGS